MTIGIVNRLKAIYIQHKHKAFAAGRVRKEAVDFSGKGSFVFETGHFICILLDIDFAGQNKFADADRVCNDIKKGAYNRKNTYINQVCCPDVVWLYSMHPGQVNQGGHNKLNRHPEGLVYHKNRGDKQEHYKGSARCIWIVLGKKTAENKKQGN